MPLTNDIKQTATKMMNTGWHVEVNRQAPYVAIEGPQEREEYFFQGEDAVDLLSDVDVCVEMFDCEPHECLLWMAASW